MGRSLILFSDIDGLLAMLHIECKRCGRAGRYRVDRLIETYGSETPLFHLAEDLTRECPKRHARETEHCDAIFPQLSSLFYRR